jgi:hypothetical protein
MGIFEIIGLLTCIFAVPKILNHAGDSKDNAKHRGNHGYPSPVTEVSKSHFTESDLENEDKYPRPRCG